MDSAAIDSLGRTSDWSGVRVVVAGFGVSGYAAADNLLFLGAQVTVVIRFWIITGLCVAGGLGVFYAAWVAVT